MKGWAIERGGELIQGTVGRTRVEAWRTLVGVISGLEMWRRWRRRQQRHGYRAIPVVVTPARPSKGQGRGR